MKYKELELKLIIFLLGVIFLISQCIKYCHPPIEKIVETHMVYDTWSEFHPSKDENIADCGNNPGCITQGYDKYDTLAIGYIDAGPKKFLVFPDSVTGWHALQERILQAGDENIISFMNRYVNPIPKWYIKELLNTIKGKPTDRVSDHIDKIDIICKTIAKCEGWTTGHNYPLKKISRY